MDRWCWLVVFFFPLTLAAIDMDDPLGDSEIKLPGATLSGRIALAEGPLGEMVKLLVNGAIIGVFPNPASFSRTIRGFVEPPYEIKLTRMDGEILLVHHSPSYGRIDLSEAGVLNHWFAEKLASYPEQLNFLNQVRGRDPLFDQRVYRHLRNHWRERGGGNPMGWPMPENWEEALKNFAEEEKRGQPFPPHPEFVRDILPLLDRKCGHCHGSTAPTSSGELLPLWSEADLKKIAGRVQERVAFKKDMPPPGSIPVMTTRERAGLHEFLEQLKNPSK